MPYNLNLTFNISCTQFYCIQFKYLPGKIQPMGTSFFFFENAYGDKLTSITCPKLERCKLLGLFLLFQRFSRFFFFLLSFLDVVRGFKDIQIISKDFWEVRRVYFVHFKCLTIFQSFESVEGILINLDILGAFILFWRFS